MQSRRVFSGALGVCLSVLAMFATPAAGQEGDAAPARWEVVQKEANLTIYGRTRPGSSIRELRGVCTFDAPNWVIKNVIDDGDHYAEFMPNVLEGRVVSRDPAQHTSVSYAKLSAPLISPRDYVVLVHDESRAEADGRIIYRLRWAPTAQGPAEQPGVVRLKVNEGSWTLEPIDDGRKTRATYQLYSDGGGLPAFILNRANTQRVEDQVTAIAKRAQLPSYRKEKPVDP